MPVYPDGGTKGLEQTIATRIRRPRGQYELSSSIVFVNVLIDREGKIRRPEVIKGIHPDFDQEALRVIQTLDPFIPGRQNGQPVDVEYIVRVPFPRSTEE